MITIDPAMDALLACASSDEQSLWYLTEGTAATVEPLRRLGDCQVSTNRFDVHSASIDCGLTSCFSDWREPRRLFDAVYLRICKEKQVNLHLANAAWQNLRVGGRLNVAGQKDEGIKSLAANLTLHFDVSSPLRKSGNSYLVQLRKTRDSDTPPFDKLDYESMQTITEIRGRPVWSKPGVYGWKKVDPGSRLLVETIASFAASFKDEQVLDLGCGYGYLTLATGGFQIAHYTATDNNAAALECTAQNAEVHALPVTVVAGDCADTIETLFDTVLCNPPFHLGFAVEASLTETFLAAARRCLKPNGRALFVTNSFIPIEKKAVQHFASVATLANNRQFKVCCLEKPRKRSR